MNRMLDMESDGEPHGVGDDEQQEGAGQQVLGQSRRRARSSQASRAAAAVAAAAAGGAGLGAGQSSQVDVGLDEAWSADKELAVLKVYRLRMGAPVAHVACGANHTLVAMESRGVWAFGSNTNGQLGLPTETPFCSRAVSIPELAAVQVVHVAGGGAHSACVTLHGDAWTWGDSSWGQGGTGVTVFSQPPTKVKALNGKRVKQVGGEPGQGHALQRHAVPFLHPTFTGCLS